MHQGHKGTLYVINLLSVHLLGSRTGFFLSIYQLLGTETKKADSSRLDLFTGQNCRTFKSQIRFKESLPNLNVVFYTPLKLLRGDLTQINIISQYTRNNPKAQVGEINEGFRLREESM